MANQSQRFLKEVIGKDGSEALAKAVSSNDTLSWALLPRVLFSWLEVVSNSDYNDKIPGTDIDLSFKKSEDNYTGRIDIGNEVYTFRDTSLFHVAGSIAVALGSDEPAPELKSPSLAKLGKSIDLLVRSRTLRKAHGAARGSLPSTTAKPLGPKLPTVPAAPTRKQAKGVVKVAAPEKPAATKTSSQTGASGPKKPAKPDTVAKVKPAKQILLPGQKAKSAESTAPKLSSVKVGKSESVGKCATCGKAHFNGKKYVGCICFESLAKSTKTTVLEDGYRIEFGDEWNLEGIAVLAEMLGK
jgi:hypothetical protein